MDKDLLEGILTLVVLTILGCSAYVMNRILKVTRFLHFLNHQALDYGKRHIDEIVNKETTSAYEWFQPLWPSFERCLFSRRPLRMEEWFDNDTINRINS